ncbi:hypothetical protein A3C98_00050 [Candidatus Roizmanbacteria bacterium RIFCSPHIGHO2_02_FULL_37_15]|uniref:Methyltransferase domain-containing protein n=1 Tax=Candidatus Roizmanbacteria bacterium RIFCSPLOWO2_01_FULL_37_16 TaxID=1802058 RepID=A0A1F7IKR0_9BACT|nr:MAG: hypothetical protein A2859_04765 [Candidatus Roizmanbacteria bacterium RIFCSPHIGHO2_01_FULL_37_16b]OGK22271.1 MAG: hypothetical protein A3C98_00050 [Candidatus Roizmanbacteria bacterium RIFCSPHIGHO2_02_FULL_37_15]OGK31784.1 MAG: hypothetical protein A3F57_00375 [Candidatus Roizmanbacteria bacterium RIFCSPHIGHO2_12_FULL_36_11]OGK43944.1 MAG: hypothetical protein A3B40_04010 [Candidatus Roizmanbacteria bacterium RIFCSPLOWO2_01_FULL_37_16]OGK56436.1 MAG: hypothetical protein A3I50_00335 [C
MFALFLYFLAIFAELAFAFGFAVVTISFIYSSIKGSPYVPTKQKVINQILKQANLKKNLNFFELGCGDGRVCREATNLYKVNALGIDVNPILIWYARLLAKIKGDTKSQFIIQNIFNVDLSKANVVYLFLMPKMIDQLLPKFDKELKQQTLVISHGFKIVKWANKLRKKISQKPFPTYFYQK